MRSAGQRIGRRPLSAAPVVALAMGLCLLAEPAVAQKTQGPARQDILEKKNQIKQLQFEKQQVLQRLEDFRDSESEILEKIRELSGQIRDARRRERELEARRAHQQRIAGKQQAEIQRLAAAIAKTRARAAGHLRRMYRLSKSSDSATLMALARHKDFFKNSHYLSLVIRVDLEAVRKFEGLTNKMESRRAAVKTTQARLASLEADIRRERSELGRARKSLRKSLKAMRGNKKLYRSYLAELDALRKGMETAVLKLEHNARDARRMAQFSDPESVRGRLPPPAPGKLIAAFGQQDPRYELKKFQRGVVIRVREAAPVRAVAPGRVVHAGPFRGYQKLVVLDHGKGLFTVYGHLEALQVERGGTVSAGTQLGASTYQPVNSAYDVYFEIRLKGEPQDPLKWLRPGSLTGAAGNGSGS